MWVRAGRALTEHMSLFRRKDGDGIKTPKRRMGDLALVDGAPVPPHRLTMDMARAESLATMMAHSRAASTVEVADLLAGMYIYEWERLSKYWDDKRRSGRISNKFAASARSAGTIGLSFTTGSFPLKTSRKNGNSH